MVLCKCGKEAKYQFKNGNWCCSSHQNKCEYYKKLIKNQSIEIKENNKKICNYGCGQEAKYQFKNGLYCCNKYTSQCPEVKNKNIEKNIGKSVSKETIEKIKIKNTGKKRSKEQCLKISMGLKGKKLGKENSFFGKKHSINTIEKIIEANKKSRNDPNSRFNSKAYKEKCKQSAKKFRTSKRGRELSRKAANLKWLDVNQRKNQSDKIKEKFKDPNFIENFNYSIMISPNKKEKFLIEILEEILPSKYRFTGNRSFWVSGKNPDFKKNGIKKVIEHLGDYYHSKKFTGKSKKIHEKDLIEHYKKYGFEVLLIWEKELSNINKLKKKILKFDKE